MNIQNATLEELIQYFYDNYEIYMKKTRENAKYNSLGKIILEDYADEDNN